jgi:hypothetical protein
LDVFSSKCHVTALLKCLCFTCIIPPHRRISASLIALLGTVCLQSAATCSAKVRESEGYNPACLLRSVPGNAPCLALSFLRMYPGFGKCHSGR